MHFGPCAGFTEGLFPQDFPKQDVEADIFGKALLKSLVSVEESAEAAKVVLAEFVVKVSGDKLFVCFVHPETLKGLDAIPFVMHSLRAFRTRDSVVRRAVYLRPTFWARFAPFRFLL
jgi:hypothetical protein